MKKLSPAAQQRLDRYLSKVAQELRSLSVVERHDLLAELQTHVEEVVANLSGSDEVDAVEAALAGLGSPREVACNLLPAGTRLRWNGAAVAIASVLGLLLAGSGWLAWSVQSLRLAQTQQRLQEAEREAGLTSLKGPGVIVELWDVERSPLRQTDSSADPLIVHDVDLLQVVNELNAAGAEAIAINGQRMTAMTAIYWNGPVICVDNAGIGNPYRVVALGPPEALLTTLRQPGSVLDLLRSVGIRVKVRQEEAVSIPAAQEQGA
jgi:hypothetical protein